MTPNPESLPHKPRIKARDKPVYQNPATSLLPTSRSSRPQKTASSSGIPRHRTHNKAEDTISRIQRTLSHNSHQDPSPSNVDAMHAGRSAALQTLQNETDPSRKSNENVNRTNPMNKFRPTLPMSSKSDLPSASLISGVGRMASSGSVSTFSHRSTSSSSTVVGHQRSTTLVATKPKPANSRSLTQLDDPLSKGKSHIRQPKALDLSSLNMEEHSVKDASALNSAQQISGDVVETPFANHAYVERELLQLLVLYSDSFKVHSQWRNSAKAHFETRFTELAERHGEIADIVNQTQELKNRAAVADWCRNVVGSEIDSRVRTLSKCLQEVYEDLDPGGRYSNAIKSFETWFAQAAEIRRNRQFASLDQASGMGHMEDIGAGWQNEVDALQRRISCWTGELRTLGSVDSGSTLGQLLVLLQDLAIDMLTEMDCIRSIERELMAQEKSWMEEQIMDLSRRVHKEMRDARKTPSKSGGHI
ncbi:MAG: hypothetical protein Q9174_001537 [Haloplaca sp. 1 TL-2023]